MYRVAYINMCTGRQPSTSSPNPRPSLPLNASKIMPPRSPTKSRSSRRRRKVGPRCSRYIRMVDSVFIK